MKLKIGIGLTLLLMTFIAVCNVNSMDKRTIMENIKEQPYGELSYELIQAIRYDKPTDKIVNRLAMVEEDVLAAELHNDDRRKAFWVNVYNGFVILFLKQDSTLYEDRSAFFKEKRITIAGKKLSFDDIEHGIIRRSKVKLSLGFLSKWRVDDFEKKFRTDEVDYRVHFALNCGAKSCPAVAAYTADSVDTQFEKSTNLHLNKTSTFDNEVDEVHITSLFSWFRGDFGGKKDVKQILKKHGVVPPTEEDVDIEYNTYDWTLDIDNFVDL